eukprot:423222-Amphidinium_carterae.1
MQYLVEGGFLSTSVFKSLQAPCKSLCRAESDSTWCEAMVAGFAQPPQPQGPISILNGKQACVC